MTDDTDHREQGVEFGDLAAALDAHEYPATATELTERYGDHTLGLPDGEESFAEALGPLAESDGEERYDSAEDVRQAVLNMVGGDAVGREGYSDRGGASEAESDADQQSL